MTHISFYNSNTGKYIKQWPNWSGVVPAMGDVVVLHYGDNNEEERPYLVKYRVIDGTKSDNVKIYIEEINYSPSLTDEEIEDLRREMEPALREHLRNAYGILLPTINPLGEWTGGPDVDCGATNRKLGSDMGDGVTGGGLHGKDLSKADVSVNIWCYLESIRTGHEVTACCSIGDESVCGVPYAEIVEQARLYIHTLGGFEKFAMWGLIRPLDV